MQVSLMIVGVFIFCHSIRWIPNVWELFHSSSSRQDKVGALLHQIRPYYWKCNFPMTPPVCLLVGWLVGRSSSIGWFVS